MATSHGITQSAAWAFAQTFLPLPPGTVRRRAGTNNLPAKLLLIIFQLVFLERMTDLDLLDDFDALSPSLFPFAFAAICSLWRNVMSSIPKYWTNVVIFVDSEVTCPEANSSQFLWSRALMLDVDVFGRAVDTQGTIMSKVMERHINPNLDRTRTLCFDVKASSCLPLFPVDFNRVTHLEHLCLECAQDDGRRDVSDLNVPMNPMESKPLFPVLEELVIDGWGYLNACKRDREGWLDAVKNVDHLTVTRCTPRAGESFSTYAFIRPLKDMAKLSHVHIVDVDLCHGLPESHEDPTTLRSWLDDYWMTLEFRDIRNFQVVSELVHHMPNAHHTILIKSVLGRPADYFTRGCLTLEDIDEAEDMTAFLSMWQGVQLTVRRCPGFNNQVLDALSKRESLRELVIVDCPNFAVQALKCLVKSLAVNFRCGNFVLEMLAVSGELLPPFLDAIGWFTEHVPEFRYQSDSYIWKS